MSDSINEVTNIYTNNVIINRGLTIISFIRKYKIIAITALIVLIVVGFYFYKFHYELSNKNEAWGTFGDYVGGIFNPVIAVFVLYWIVETYKLQKTELQETKRLINDQVKLAALTALLESNLTRIGLLRTEKAELLNEIPVDLRPKATDTRSNGDMMPFDEGMEKSLSGECFPRVQKIREINGEIKSLTKKITTLEEQIEVLLKEKIE